MKKGASLRNTSWLLAGGIARMLIQFIVGAISARYLGPSNYGILNYAAAYINLFSIICEFGLTITIVSELVKHRDIEGVYVGTAISMRLLASVISTFMLLMITVLVDGNDPIIRGVVLIRAAGLIFDSFNTISYWFHSHLQSKYTTIYELIAYILSSVYKIAILVFKKNIFWFAAATTIDSAIIAFFLIYGYKKHSGSKLSISKDLARSLTSVGLPFILSGIMVYVYDQTDRIMIGNMMTQADVGFYSCAATIGTMIAFIPQAIMNSGKPVIMEAKKESHSLFELRMRQTLAAVLWIMNLYGVFVFVFGHYIILILFGKSYIESVTALRILIWSFGLSYVGTLRNVWLICNDLHKYASLFSFIGAISNVVLNLIMIRLLGIEGAAIATVFTQFLTIFCAPLIFPKTRRFSLLLKDAFLLRNVELKNMLKRFSAVLRKRLVRR